ncbi:hypothetical protein P7K49_004410, partial [Saguinus oedipus]
MNVCGSNYCICCQGDGMGGSQAPCTIDHPHLDEMPPAIQGEVAPGKRTFELVQRLPLEWGGSLGNMGTVPSRKSRHMQEEQLGESAAGFCPHEDTAHASVSENLLLKKEADSRSG